jgi:hypothetical protein
MVTNITDFGFALDELLRFWTPRVRSYVVVYWQDVHSLVRLEGAGEIAFGSAAKGWLPSPSKACLARLANYAEEQDDPEFVLEIAAVLQRLAAHDPTCRAHFLELCTAIEDLGRIHEGCAGLALHAEAELDQLLAAGAETWSTIDQVLGEEHCRTKDLLVLAWRRLERHPDDWREILTVIRRLQAEDSASIRSSPAYSSSERGDVLTTLAFLDFLILLGWLHSSGVTEEELVTWAKSLNRRKD